MIYLGFPYGSNFGWGVLGKEVALAMAELTDVSILAPPHADQRLEDEFDAFRLRRLIASAQYPGHQADQIRQINGPVIQTAVGRELIPFVSHVPPPYDVAYAVFEENHLPPA